MIKVGGGIKKGQTIYTLRNLELRPTSAKVKEALFNILGEKIIAANFLDLFAGSGSVGIEALSRGAGQCTFVEKNKTHFTLLKKNIGQVHIEQKATLLCQDAFHFNSKGHLFDIVYIDPPYGYELLEKLLLRLGQNDMMQKNGIMVVEHFKKTRLNFRYGSLDQTKRYSYGDTILTSFRYK